jgi:CBS domain-containing protein
MSGSSTQRTRLYTTTGLVHCYLDSTLRDVVGLVNDARIHRVYVVDEQRKPVGVVSLTDIFHNLTPLLA